MDVEDRSALRLNFKTDQNRRIFQDHSHVFYLLSRPTKIKANINVNVQGKRGNIAQVYPAVEYDFIPNNLQQTPYIYNVLGLTLTTMGGGDGGDGQARDEGQGKDGRFKVIKTQEQLKIPKRNVCVLVQFTYRY